MTTFLDDGGEIELHLTPMEERMFSVLVDEPFRVFTHDELWQAVWGFKPVHGERKAVLIRDLRRKLAGIGVNAIFPRYTVGYSFRKAILRPTA